jgi:hypothetical protein
LWLPLRLQSTRCARRKHCAPPLRATRCPERFAEGTATGGRSYEDAARDPGGSARARVSSPAVASSATGQSARFGKTSVSPPARISPPAVWPLGRSVRADAPPAASVTFAISGYSPEFCKHDGCAGWNRILRKPLLKTSVPRRCTVGWLRLLAGQPISHFPTRAAGHKSTLQPPEAYANVNPAACSRLAQQYRGHTIQRLP